MADLPSVRTQTLSRDEIAGFARSPRQIKFFENLGEDVAKTLPEATQQALAAAESAQTAANAAAAAAVAAQTAANAAQAAVTALGAVLDQLGLDSVPAIIGAIQSQIQVTLERVAAIEEGPPR